MKDKLEKIISNSTKESQVMQAIEEFSELTKELIKNINRGKENKTEILSELADVKIMIEQLRIIYKINEKDIEIEMEHKINRYFKRKNWQIS